MYFLKKRSLIILCALFGAVAVTQADFQIFKIDSTAAQQSKRDVHNELSFIQKKRYALIGCALAAVTGLSYYTYMNFSNTAGTASTGGCYQLPAFGSLQWLKNRVHGTMNRSIELLAAGVGVQYVRRHVEDIYKKNDLYWYIGTHTSLTRLVDEMKASAQVLDHASVYTPEQQKQIAALLTDQVTILFKQITAVVGFMEYTLEKKGIFADASLYQSLLKKLYDGANTFGFTIEQQINNESTSLQASIDHFWLLFNSVIHSFAQIDR